MSVDNELQHLALSKIVGKVPNKAQRGFSTYHFVVGEPVPYLQGEDDSEIDGDASWRWETISSNSHEWKPLLRS